MNAILNFAILSSIAAAPLMAESFTRDGESYTYETKSVGDHQIISGTHLTSGKSFHLRVKGARVSGRFGDRPVQFNIATAKVAANGSATMLAAK